MSCYSWFGKEPEVKLHTDLESGLNILVKEVQFEDFFNKIENKVNNNGFI